MHPEKTTGTKHSHNIPVSVLNETILHLRCSRGGRNAQEREHKRSFGHHCSDICKDITVTRVTVTVTVSVTVSVNPPTDTVSNHKYKCNCDYDCECGGVAVVVVDVIQFCFPSFVVVGLWSFGILIWHLLCMCVYVCVYLSLGVQM